MRNSIRQHGRNRVHRKLRRAPALVVIAALALTAGLAPKAGGEAPASKWQTAIDARWGPGPPTERKLEIFDAFWKTIDERFAAFEGLDVNWVALRDRYRPEIAAGVGRGRFAGITSHLSIALCEMHTFSPTRGRVGATEPHPGPHIPKPLGRVSTALGAVT